MEILKNTFLSVVLQYFNCGKTESIVSKQYSIKRQQDQNNR